MTASSTQGRETSTLPPGQRAIKGFPRFGTHFHLPAPGTPTDPVIEIVGEVTTPVVLPLADLGALPRRELTADFHCVSGWSAINLHWEGVAFETLYREIIEPSQRPSTSITHIAFQGLDGFRSIVSIADALADGVLIAEHLNGRPLDSDHGGPVRLVSPSQYGYKSVKHLCRIELHTAPPAERYHPSLAIQFGLRLVAPHPRARVWQEERHGYLPARIVRPIYRPLIAPIKFLSARGSKPESNSP